MKPLRQLFEKGTLGEEGGLGAMFAGLDLDGRRGMFQAEKEGSGVFEVCGSLCALIARAQEACVWWCGEDLAFQAIEGSGQIDGGDLGRLQVDGDCHRIRVGSLRPEETLLWEEGMKARYVRRVTDQPAEYFRAS